MPTQIESHLEIGQQEETEIGITWEHTEQEHMIVKDSLHN